MRQQVKVLTKPVRINPVIPPPVINNIPSPTQTTTDHDRYVFWLHGFGGNGGAWVKPAEASQGIGPNYENALPDFPARRLKSKLLDYNSPGKNNSLVEAATYLKGEISDANAASSQIHNIDITKNFMIAHSEGGIVSRMYEKLVDTETNLYKFGGLVTFGSTHGGAQVINGKAKIFTLSEEACSKLAPALIDARITKIVDNLEGLNKTEKYIIDEFRSLIVDPVLEYTKDEINELLCQNILPFELNTAFAGQLKPISNDYKVGAQPITELTNFSTSIPKVSVYGTEEDNHLWRALHSIIVAPAGEEPLFAAQDDGTIVTINNLFATMYGEIDNREAQLKKLKKYRDKLNILINLNPVPSHWHVELSKTLTEIKNTQTSILRQQDGINFLGKMNEKWLTIMGGRSYIYENTETVYNCLCSTNLNGTGDTVSFPIEAEYQCSYPGMHCIAQYVPLPIAIPVYKPNDAVALNESSLQMPGVNQTREMTGSNHMQMRNDENLKIVLNALYYGDIMVYFKTEKRNQ